MDRLTEIEVLAIGAVIIVLLVAGTYIAVENKEEIKEAVESPITQSALGIPLAREVYREGELYYDITRDLSQGSLERARDDYERISGYPDAIGWEMIMGKDYYNNGVASFHYAEIRENAEVLSKRYGDVTTYLKGEGASALALMSLGGKLSPFITRQNIDILPFSGSIHGILGSSAGTFKEQIWTIYDEVPEATRKWTTLTDAKKREYIGAYNKDKELMIKMLDKKDYNVWIIRDRIVSMKSYYDKYNINV